MPLFFSIGAFLRRARTRAPAHPKKTRGVAVQAALAAAAPPITATNYAAAALAAAANPHPPSA